MEIEGKIIMVLPLLTGEGKNGTWRRQDIILETEDRYPKKVCVSFWTDKIVEAHLQMGNKLRVKFDIESREYNGRWYTDIRAWESVVIASSGYAPAVGAYGTGPTMTPPAYQPQNPYQQPNQPQYQQPNQPMQTPQSPYQQPNQPVQTPQAPYQQPNQPSQYSSSVPNQGGQSGYSAQPSQSADDQRPETDDLPF